MIDSDLTSSFRTFGAFDFEAINPSGVRPSPVYAVANVALRRVQEGAEITLPEGYSNEVLESICWLTGYVERPTRISGRQGYELRDIGEQILSLDEHGQIQPPLNTYEKEAIHRLVQVVATAEAGWQKSPDFP